MDLMLQLWLFQMRGHARTGFVHGGVQEENRVTLS
jgi:hypothetical protein